MYFLNSQKTSKGICKTERVSKCNFAVSFHQFIKVVVKYPNKNSGTRLE